MERSSHHRVTEGGNVSKVAAGGGGLKLRKVGQKDRQLTGILWEQEIGRRWWLICFSAKMERGKGVLLAVSSPFIGGNVKMRWWGPFTSQPRHQRRRVVAAVSDRRVVKALTP
jgi:hypothetical protein